MLKTIYPKKALFYAVLGQILALFTPSPLSAGNFAPYAPSAGHFTHMASGDQKVLIYGVTHGKDDKKRQDLYSCIQERKAQGTQIKTNVSLSVEDPSCHPGFENFLPKESDFLLGLTKDLSQYSSPNFTVQNCDPRKVSWLAINMFHNGCYPTIPHHTPQMLTYTFGDLFGELNTQINVMLQKAEYAKKYNLRSLSKTMETKIAKAFADYDVLEKELKSAHISLSDSIAIRALDLFAHEVNNHHYYVEAKKEFKNTQTLQRLLCTAQHAPEELTACLVAQENIKKHIPAPYNYVTGSRGKIGNILATLTDPLLEIPAVVDALDNTSSTVAYFVGDVHRQNMKSLFSDAGFRQQIVVDYSTINPENLLSYDEEAYTPDTLKHLVY